MELLKHLRAECARTLFAYHSMHTSREHVAYAIEKTRENLSNNGKLSKSILASMHN